MIFTISRQMRQAQYPLPPHRKNPAPAAVLFSLPLKNESIPGKEEGADAP
jgi:hypothetical protein